VKAILVAGARPNFMKVAPVLRALEAREVTCSLVHTGQHYDDKMSDVFFDELGIREPDVNLAVGSGTHAEQTAAIMQRFEPIVEKIWPDVVVVVGDVNSTVACSLVAAKLGPLVAHVEAGLRSRDWDMPEEVNRVVTDRLSDYLLAPSRDAVANLEAEGYRADQIHLVGNVMVDTLLVNLERARASSIHQSLGLTRQGYGFVTLHRPSNVDDPVVLGRILDALATIARRVPLVFAAHPRTRARLETLGPREGVTIVEPIPYLDTIALVDRAALVLTDSGGLQEETTVLGIPCLTIRENTERPITITEGTNHLVGTDVDRIVATATAALEGSFEPRRPELWDGRASERIADVLVTGGGPTGHLRPTDLAEAGR
jgi:UDP-N-acetylglucosamine 2-epimerase (non-hydrolysing)